MTKRETKEEVVTGGRGSRRDPYVRKDGERMVKWGMSVPIDFVQDFRAFSGTLPLGTSGSEWVVKTLSEAMARERRKAG